MLIARLIAFLVALVLLSSSLKAEELRFCRHPAPSPDGSLMAFSYQGDIWIGPGTGGDARRVTVHPAYDASPVWSPDGTWLAFNSMRFGSRDVFAVNLATGRFQRLTWHSSTDSVTAFSPDGAFVYFTSSRPKTWSVRPLLYRVRLKGGQPLPVSGAAMRHAHLSVDGRFIVFSRGRVGWTRRGYRGAAEMNIWLCRLEGRRYGALLDGPGNHRWPLLSPTGKTLMYCSDRDGVSNLWALDLITRKERRLTRFQTFGVRFPRISADGGTIAFARGDGLYTLHTADGSMSAVSYRAPVDRRRTQHRTFTAEAAEFTVAPKGKDLAFSLRGELFALPLPDKDGGRPVERRAMRLCTSEARERYPAFSPDGRTLVFASDPEGNYDLFRMVSADPKEPRLSKALRRRVELLVGGPQDETRPVFSPDGSKIAFQRGPGELWVLTLSTGKETRVTQGWNLRDFSWSPDGQWFAFSRVDNEYNTDVFVINADGSTPPLNVSQHPDDDHSPAWFPNGRGLAFVSRRNRDNDDIWMVFLRQEDTELPPDLLWEQWSGREGLEDAPESEKSEKKEPAPPPEVRIDAEDIHLRLRQLTSLLGDERNVTVSPDSLTLFFSAEIAKKRGLWKVLWDGSDLGSFAPGLNPSGCPVWGPKGKELFYRTSRGKLGALSPKSGKTRGIAFKASMTLDFAAERRQVFGETHRLLSKRFYDPSFHGADWARLKKMYEPLVTASGCPEDFSDAMNMMLGELNASHVGFRSSSTSTGDDQTGCLGVVFDPAFEGPGLSVASVVPRSPADRKASRLVVGDVIRSIAGTRVDRQTNVHRLLNHTAGRKVLLEVARGRDPVMTLDVVIRPFGVRDLSRALYEAYVRENRRRVADWSQGRLAYVHVRGMNWSSFERFERELYSAAHGRDGLLIDVRNNGGGWTADMLLSVLCVRPHAKTRSRGGGFGYPQGRRPFYAWTKPTAVLCNEASFSNAEIFSHAFKTLRRGPLVGRPTFGGVISTGGTVLLDGSWLRLPTRGWWIWPDGPDMELNGAVPHHDVPLGPADEEKGLDPQLRKAADVLLKDLAGQGERK